MDSGLVPPSREALAEALSLSEAILANLDLGGVSLAAICLKTARLARLLNDVDMERIFSLDVSGYPRPLSSEDARLGRLAGRTVTNEYGREAFRVRGVGALEEELELRKVQLGAASDPDYSFSSGSELIVPNPPSNRDERIAIVQAAAAAREELDARREFVHAYVRRTNSELKFSTIPADIFSRARERVDGSIGKHLPDSVDKLAAIYNNLLSESSEDWSNAVHGCRRLLVALADALFPPTTETWTVLVEGKEQETKLGAQEYKNRLLAFVGDHSASASSVHLIGSHIGFLVDRLDAICDVANIGSHEVVVKRADADRYVIYTYLLVADILDLKGGH